MYCPWCENAFKIVLTVVFVYQIAYYLKQNSYEYLLKF